MPVPPSLSAASAQPKQEIKAFPIWASMLLMSIGMCFLALGGLAIYYDMSIWVVLLCGLIAFKAFNTPWIYNYFLRRLKGQPSAAKPMGGQP